MKLHRFGPILALTVFAGPAAADNQPLTGHFSGGNSCYERLYSNQHLAAHPTQKVTAVRLDHFPRHAGPFGNDGRPMIYPEAQEIVVYLKVRMRGVDQDLLNTGFCRPDGQAMSCGIECDGGRFLLEDRGPGRLLLRPKGDIYFSDCGEGDIALSPEPDDRSFLLHRLPDSACNPPG